MEDEQLGDALIEEPATPPAAPLALYRRYRPDTFAQIIGQHHVTDPLQRALVNNRVNHAYLFSGPRGCGKTTSARILARALNCEQAPVAEPCGECQSCRDLARGGSGSIDVIEIDAASHGGVDDARDLRERAFFAPVASRYKIYIVDEAHMVTTAGFNAMLKLVEEPPPHVKFIFATTEPDKVIGTIRSRTHHYPFRLVPPKILGEYLSELCDAEGIAVEPAVLPLVVRSGGGSVRDSLSVLDQLLGGASGEGVGYQQAVSLLGYTPDSLLDEVLDAFAAGDASGVFSAVDKVIEVGQDPRRFAEDLLRRLRDLVIVAAVPDAIASGLVSVAEDQGERLTNQAASLGAGELTRAAEVIAAGLTDMRGTTAPRLHLELMCARVLLPGSDVDERGVHARLDRLERRIGMVSGVAAPDQPPAAQPEQARPPEPDPAPAPVEQADEEPLGEAVDTPTREVQTSRGAPVKDQRAGSAEEAKPLEPSTDPSAAEVSPPKQAGGPSISTADVRRLWPEVLEEVKRRRRFTWILISQNAHVTGVHDGVLTLGLSNAGARDSFSRGGSENVVREAIVQVIGVDLRIESIVDAASGGSGSAPNPRNTGPGFGSNAEPAADSDFGMAPDRSPVTAAAPAQASPSVQSPAAASDNPDDSIPRSHLRAVPNEPAEGTAEESDAPAESSPRPGLSSRAREEIRGTRLQVVRERGRSEPEDEPDRSDSDADEADTGHNELLARHLGAQLIGEESPEGS